MSGTQNRPLLAILLKVTAVMLFTIMAALVKFATQTVPVGEAVFFRSSLALPVIVFWIWRSGNLKHGLVPHSLIGHVWRGLFGTSAMMLTFAGLSLIPLPEATAISYATPIFTVILAAIMLGERLRIFRLSAVFLGLIGVMIVMAPRLSLDQESLSTGASLGALMILGASLLRGLVQIHIRKMVASEETSAIVFYFSLTASVLSLFTIPFGWIWPEPMALAALIGAGGIGGVAQILVTSSYRFGGPSMLAPFDYASMIFAALLGYFWFDELPTANMLLGALLVAIAGVIIIYRERKLSQQNQGKST